MVWSRTFFVGKNVAYTLGVRMKLYKKAIQIRLISKYPYNEGIYFVW